MLAPRLIFWLSLLAVLTGTPAREVEAAADLARTLTSQEDAAEVEEVDGGVGDDSLEAVPTAANPLDGSLSAGVPVDRLVAFSPLWFPTLLGPATIEPVPSPPPDRPGRRQARLQRFRF